MNNEEITRMATILKASWINKSKSSSEREITRTRQKKESQPAKVHVNAPHHHQHLDQCSLTRRMYIHSLSGTNFTDVMMTRGCMHVSLSIKKVMSMHHVCMHLLIIIIKIFFNPRRAAIYILYINKKR
jgi:hypothetical protein